MGSNQVMLVLFCGEVWSSLCGAAPRHAESHSGTAATGPRADKPLLSQLQPTGASSHQSDRPLAATEPPAFPGEEDAGDGSWVAALILGIILIGMMLAIFTILLWKCCMRPALAESHWAGRSPFVDGDTPELFMDSDQGTKRSSVLFMLPWRLKQGTNLQEELTVPENPPQHTHSPEDGQPPLPAPAPAHAAADPCAPPDTPAECSDLPPPPDWLREAPEEPSSDPGKRSALPWEAEEPQPSPPELPIQESHETLPQPEHPL